MHYKGKCYAAIDVLSGVHTLVCVKLDGCIPATMHQRPRLGKSPVAIYAKQRTERDLIEDKLRYGEQSKTIQGGCGIR